LHRAIAAQVVERAESGEKAIHKPFWYFIALRIEHSGVRHQVTDVTHKKQAAAGQAQRAAVWARKRSVRL
jgi:hypothetical protein